MAPLTFMRISYYLLIQSHPASCWLTPLPNSHYREHCTLIKPNNTAVVSESRKYEEASARSRNSWHSSEEKKHKRESRISLLLWKSSHWPPAPCVCEHWGKYDGRADKSEDWIHFVSCGMGWGGVSKVEGTREARNRGWLLAYKPVCEICLSPWWHPILFPYFNTDCYLLPPAMSLCSLRQRVIKL